MAGGLGLLEGAESGPSKEVSKQPAECRRILNVITLLLWNFSGDAKVKNTIVGTPYLQSLRYCAKSSQQDQKRTVPEPVLPE